MNPFIKDIHNKEKFSTIVLENEVIQDINFEYCSFVGCRFIACIFKNCKFVNCAFNNSDVSASKIMGSLFLDVTFENSRAMSIDWGNASSGTVLSIMVNFYKTNINYSSFAGLNLKKVQIIECMANDVDFAESDLENANFEGSDLKDSIFSHTNLKKANFVKAINYAINPTINNVKNARFALPYAAVLLKPFEVVIEDEYGEKLLDR